MRKMPHQRPPVPLPAPTGGRRSGRRRRGRWAAGALSFAVLATSCGGWAVLNGVGSSLDRVDAIGGGPDRPSDDGAATFLVVGTDERAGIPESTLKDVLHAGGESCHCTDTMMVVQLSADGGRATVVSVPRDSYVDIPAHQDPATGRQVAASKGKINAAYGMGGAPLAVRTVEQNTGLRIDHYVEVNFLAFVSTVDALGGVEVCTAKPLRDDYSGLDLPAGTTRLDGAGALRYVRARHVDGSADLGRMRRQQEFLAQLLHRAAGGALLDPAKLSGVLETVLRSVKVDKGLGNTELLDFAGRLKDLSASNADFATVPLSEVDHQVPGWGSTVLWDEKGAAALFEAVRAGRPLTGAAASAAPAAAPAAPAAVPPPVAAAGAPPAAGTVPPEQVRVQVLNGTGVQGLGSRVDAELRRAGFATTGTPSNAPGGGSAAPRTVIRYDPRWDESVKTLAAALPDAELVPVPNLGPTFQVVAGSAYRAPADPAASAAPATAAAAAAEQPGPTAAAATATATAAVAGAASGSAISCPS
ncbi:LytR family transcriptional attenuator [Kitasatospora sp. SolWspMP-SS2h]|nr:LytR family transcriptional attenuator [Kitasatospora sp. SolWspMP-SS2h]